MAHYGEFVVGKRVADDNVPNHYKEIDIFSHKISKPTVLIFGGSGVESNALANGSAKIIESLLGVFGEDVDLLSVNYNAGTYNEETMLANIGKIVNNLILPLATNLSKERLTVFDACKNMRQVTLFGHCFGDSVITKLTEMLNSRLLQVGYLPQEADKITKSLFAVTFGATTVNDKINYINIISPNDEMFPNSGDRAWEVLANRLKDADKSLPQVKISKEDRDEIVETVNSYNLLNPRRVFGSGKILQEFYNNNQRCFVLGTENGIRLVTSPLYTNGEFDHSIKGLARDANWQESVCATPAGNYVSKCIAAALCNSVANSILNQNSKNYIPFDMSNLQIQLEQIVQPLNERRQNAQDNI